MCRADLTTATRTFTTSCKKSYDICQREADTPQLFRVCLPHTDRIFHRMVSLVLIYLDGKSVLHVVDRDTKFGAAAFLKEKKLLACGQCFFKYGFSLAMAGIKKQAPGVESHNALGSGERYHSFFRLVYNKIPTDAGTLPHGESLSLAVKAVNDRAGLSGLVPTLLFFEIKPRTLILPKELPTQTERMKAIQSAKHELEQLICKQSLNTALRHNVPAGADRQSTVNDEVLIYRENR